MFLGKAVLNAINSPAANARARDLFWLEALVCSAVMILIREALEMCIAPSVIWTIIMMFSARIVKLDFILREARVDSAEPAGKDALNALMIYAASSALMIIILTALIIFVCQSIAGIVMKF